MGIYLNSITPYILLSDVLNSPYFVDKSMNLLEIFPYINTMSKYICLTRPRRFGKTMMANMMGVFFQNAKDSKDIFSQLLISKSKEYELHVNKYNVIYITWNDISENCTSYKQYIERISRRLKRDLIKAYPEYHLGEEDALWDIFLDIFIQNPSERFIFIFDEWDFIFNCNFVTEEDKQNYLVFLRNLLKDRAYVSLAYMTGVLPIEKYSSGSELNMFLEYTMVTQDQFSNAYGFTEAEVDNLYERYCSVEKKPNITREELRIWYDGYYTSSGERVYNPHSVVVALLNNKISNYWTSSGPYDEIYYYVKNNIQEVRDDIVFMITGESVSSKIQEYAVTSMELKTKEQIFSAMVVYGFLTYQDGQVSIPNKELMLKFEELVQQEASLGYVYQLAKESDRMLQATLTGDTSTMSEA